MNPIYTIPFKRADDSETSLAEFSGKVLLVVNVASKCGLTPQYTGLEKIHKKYREQGFSVLGFPANEFRAQEPGTNKEIQEFCQLNYDVTFPVFAKLAVKGPSQHPLYAFLTQHFQEAAKTGNWVRQSLRKIFTSVSNTGVIGEITWNFEKFLINRKGEIVARFPPDVLPEDPVLIEVIESTLRE